VHINVFSNSLKLGMIR